MTVKQNGFQDVFLADQLLGRVPEKGSSIISSHPLQLSPIFLLQLTVPVDSMASGCLHSKSRMSYTAGFDLRRQVAEDNVNRISARNDPTYKPEGNIPRIRTITGVQHLDNCLNQSMIH